MIPGSYFELGDPPLTGCEPPLVPKDPEDPSGPQSFLLELQGVPLQTYLEFDVGSVDTIVVRQEALDFGADPQEDVTRSTPIELVALRLISSDPIEVTCDQGVTRWIAEVEVDEETGPSLGEMDVTLDHPALIGGTATSTLAICPRVTFTRIDPGTSGSFEVFPCDMLCGPELLGETTWSFKSPDPQNALKIPGLTTDNFFFTELLTAQEAAAVDAAAAKSAVDGCNPDCPCVFKYPHLSENHKHQACLPCPCDVDKDLPVVDPPAPKTVECTQRGGTSRFATCIDPDPDAGTLCVLDWLDSVTCSDRPIDEPGKISTCEASGPPAFFPAGCDPGLRTEVRFAAVDSCCNESRAASSLFVRDTLPPEVTPGSDDLYCVWPANHEYVCFERSQFTPTIDDICHDVDWKFVGCASDQPDNGDADGNTVNDCQVTCGGDVICVRAERQNTGAVGRRYAVEIQASDECGNLSTAEVIGFIHVPQTVLDGCVAPPEIHAQCSAAPTGGDVPLVVAFNDDSTSTGPVINAWDWDFGDGGTSTVQNPSHTYTVPGLYTPTLTVSTDPPGGCNPSSGLTGFATCREIDAILPPPVCNASPTTGNASLAVNFNGLSAFAGVSWLWDFGDGSTSTLQSLSHTYDVPGTFNPTVTISLNGQTETAACPAIVVTPPPPDLNCELSVVTTPPGGGNTFFDVPIVVTDSNGIPATVTIVSISQDEPVAGSGSGQTCPDAQIVTTTTPDDTARVRNERQGNGDGRVYHIEFTAVAGDGSACSGGSGEVTICIPRGNNNPCGDGGALFPSIPAVCP